MFAGTFHHTLDAKNRLVIPSRLRAVLPADGPESKGFYVSLWQIKDTKCLSLFTRSAWEDHTARIEKLGEVDENAELYAAIMNADAEYVERDAEWRIVVPESLISIVQLGSEVLLLGQRRQILVIDPQKWQAIRGQHEPNYPEIYRKVQQIKRNG